MDRQVYTLTDAARILGTSEGALRQRVRRGTVESYKDHGRVYVYLPRTSTVQDHVGTPESQMLTSAQHLEAVEARVELLEHELERAHERDRETRRLLAAALERIPSQLGSPADEREAPETVEARPERAEASKELPLWAYGLGVFLVGLTDPLLQSSPSWFPGNPNTHGGFGNPDATVG